MAARTVTAEDYGKSPASNALVRTTTAITMAKGSDAANVLASEAEVTVNFRILPGESVAGVIEHVKKLCEGYDVAIHVVSEREPSSISPENVRGFGIIKEEMAKYIPQLSLPLILRSGVPIPTNIRR